jgi:hypothetical protein
MIVPCPCWAALPERAYVALAAPMDMFKGKDFTFLTLPPDGQKLERPPDTNIISDKNRIATSRAPSLDRKVLDELVDAARPGPPGLSAPPAPPAGSQAAARSGQAAASQSGP